MNTNFQDKNLPKEKAPYNCLLITMLYSLIKAKKKYYPQTLLEECKYEQNENLIDNDLEKSLLDSEADNDYNDDE